MKTSMTLGLLSSLFLLWSATPLLAQDLGGCLPLPSNAPPCPATSSTIVDDSYPAMAYVVSSNNVSDEAAQLPATFIDEIFRGHAASTDIPIIMVPDSAENFAALQDDLRQRWSAAGHTEAVINARLNRVRSLPTSGPYTWQQDYFESFIDPATGRPSVRRVADYSRGGNEQESVEMMSRATGGSGCGVSVGAELVSTPDSSYPHEDANSGGNIEALPKGRCMIGNNQNPVYTAQFCANPSDRVVVDTDWLSVGHADEIINVVPQNPRIGACPYTFMFASPNKAFELMRRDSADNFLDVGNVTPEGTESLSEAKARVIRGRLTNENGFPTAFGERVCQAYMTHILPARNAASGGAGGASGGAAGGARRAFYQMMDRGLDTIVARVQAGPEPEVINDEELDRALRSARALGGAVSIKADTIDCLANHAAELATITNSEMLTVMQADTDFIEYNRIVQETQDRNKREIRSRYPECADSNFKDVPDLFNGEVIAGSSPPRMASKTGSSLFPNPTNGVMAGSNYIFPDPQNGAFRRYLNNSVLTGVQPRFVNTWDYAHELEGNIHCSSHAIRFCSPREGATP